MLRLGFYFSFSLFILTSYFLTTIEKNFPTCYCRLIIASLFYFQVMIKKLEEVVAMVLNLFQDPHPRVRWAAINAIGQLSTDLGPDLQVQYHQQVLPALAASMDDFQNPRLQVHKILIHGFVYILTSYECHLAIF